MATHAGHCTILKGAIHNDVSVNVSLGLEQHGGRGHGFRALNFPRNTTSDPDVNYTFKDILIPEQFKLPKVAKVYYIPLYYGIT